MAACLAGPVPARAQGADAAPDFKEVYDTIRAHLAGSSDTELNRTAVQALISALSPRVSLVSKEPTAESAATSPLLSKTALFDGAIGYVRIVRVAPTLDQAVRQAYEQLGATNRLKGLVLDLRYSGGQDYSGATGVAELFLKTERPLLDWGQGMVRSQAKTTAFSVPVAVLVNGQTAAAA
ncbi:MAG TPA: S41 family peptidase, partial [Bacillota bacterium]|nr:S41 family peptidase [Bacillota bacterium]